MKYRGLQTQIRSNNARSVFLLLMFPVIILVLVWIFIFFTTTDESVNRFADVNNSFLFAIPWVVLIVLVWFIIAWFSHTALINAATGARPLQRKDNKRVYNLVENLSIAAGMRMPAVNIIDDDSLNAFASGINDKTYTISLSRGIIDKLEDDELEGVIAHEMTHIRNRDVRLLIISIIFVGIFAFLAEALLRSFRFGSAMGRSRHGSKNGGGVAVLVALVLALAGYLIASLFRFAISRNREYMADAGAAMLTRKPLALAEALRKISADPVIEAVKRKDVAQMFIENPQADQKRDNFSISSLYATHPPITKRIEILEHY